MRKLSILFLLCAVFITQSTDAATKTWTGPADYNSYSWDTPGYWSPAGVPTSGDSVFIHAGNVKIPQQSSSAARYFNNMTIYVEGLASATPYDYQLYFSEYSWDSTNTVVFGGGLNQSSSFTFTGMPEKDEPQTHDNYRDLSSDVDIYVGGYWGTTNNNTTYGEFILRNSGIDARSNGIYIGTAGGTGYLEFSQTEQTETPFMDFDAGELVIGGSGGTATALFAAQSDDYGTCISVHNFLVGAAGTGEVLHKEGGIYVQATIIIGANSDDFMTVNMERKGAPVYAAGTGTYVQEAQTHRDQDEIIYTQGYVRTRVMVIGADTGSMFWDNDQDREPDASKPSYEAVGTYLVRDSALLIEGAGAIGFGRNATGTLIMEGSKALVGFSQSEDEGLYVGRYGGTGTLEMYAGKLGVDGSHSETYIDGGRLIIGESGHGTFNQYAGEFYASLLEIGTVNTNDFSNTAGNGVWNIYGNSLVRVGLGTNNLFYEPAYVALGGGRQYDEYDGRRSLEGGDIYNGTFGRLNNPTSLTSVQSNAQINIFGGDIQIRGTVFAATTNNSVNIYGTKATIQVGEYNTLDARATNYRTDINTNFYLSNLGVSTIDGMIFEDQWQNQHGTGNIDLGGQHEIGLYQGFVSLKDTRYDLFTTVGTMTGTFAIQDRTSLGFTAHTDAINKVAYIQFNPALLENWDWDVHGSFYQLAVAKTDGALAVTSAEQIHPGVVAHLEGTTSALTQQLVNYLNETNGMTCPTNFGQTKARVVTCPTNFGQTKARVESCVGLDWVF